MGREIKSMLNFKPMEHWVRKFSLEDKTGYGVSTTCIDEERRYSKFFAEWIGETRANSMYRNDIGITIFDEKLLEEQENGKPQFGDKLGKLSKPKKEEPPKKEGENPKNPKNDEEIGENEEENSARDNKLEKELEKIIVENDLKSKFYELEIMASVKGYAAIVIMGTKINPVFKLVEDPRPIYYNDKLIKFTFQEELFGGDSGYSITTTITGKEIKREAAINGQPVEMKELIKAIKDQEGIEFPIKEKEKNLWGFIPAVVFFNKRTNKTKSTDYYATKADTYRVTHELERLDEIWDMILREMKMSNSKLFLTADGIPVGSATQKLDELQEKFMKGAIMTYMGMSNDNFELEKADFNQIPGLLFAFDSVLNQVFAKMGITNPTSGGKTGSHQTNDMEVHNTQKYEKNTLHSIVQVRQEQIVELLKMIIGKDKEILVEITPDSDRDDKQTIEGIALAVEKGLMSQVKGIATINGIPLCQAEAEMKLINEAKEAKATEEFNQQLQLADKKGMDGNKGMPKKGDKASK